MIQTGDFQFNNGDGWQPGRTTTAWLLLELVHFTIQVWLWVGVWWWFVPLFPSVSPGGESIYGGTFNDEDFVRRHTQAKLFTRNSSGKTVSPSNAFWFVSRSTTSMPAPSQHRPQAGVVSMANKGTLARRQVDSARSGSRKNHGTSGEGWLAKPKSSISIQQ